MADPAGFSRDRGTLVRRASELAEDLEQDATNVGGTLARDLRRYVEAVSVEGDAYLPGDIAELGESFGYVLDDDSAMGALNTIHQGKLRQLNTNHRRFLDSYHPGTVPGIAPPEDPVPADTDPG